MSERTLPLLYLNMGGEMLYILEQRLVAQGVPGFKCVKVLEDVSRVLVHRAFVEELFIKSDNNNKVLRLVFDRVAHASIMRLDKHSMDKLYDLMLMATKYQVLMSRDSMDLIMVTLNHLDAIMDYASAADRENVAFVYELLVQTYCVMRPSVLQKVRYAMLNELQDVRIKVSLFLNDQKQSAEDGHFLFEPIPYHIRGASRPGQIRVYSSRDGKSKLISTERFEVGTDFDEEMQLAKKNAGLALQNQTGNRGTKLGLNMYACQNSLLEPSKSAVVNRRDSLASSSISEDATKAAREELDLIARMINSDKESCAKIKLSFLNEDTSEKEEEKEEEKGEEAKEERIALARDSSALASVMGEMDIEEQKEQKLDLLQLMDKEATS